MDPAGSEPVAVELGLLGAAAGADPCLPGAAGAVDPELGSAFEVA